MLTKQVANLEIISRNNVRVSGNGDRAIVFVHGFGCDQAMWRYVAPAFADEYQTVVFDLVGSGKSDLSAFDLERYNKLDGYARDISEVIRALDLWDVILVGHSVSAILGAIAVTNEPKRFSHLIMVAPSPRYINDLPDYFGGFEREDIDEMFELMDKNYMGWASFIAPVIMKNEDDPELAAELEASFCSTDPITARTFATATFYGDNREQLPQVPIPCLVMQCADDSIAPDEVGEYVHQHLPQSTLVKMNATGHCPHLSHPQETIALIRNYLNGVR